ncbi:IS5 family transposase [Pseudomonas aeruginosa]|uniref:IS5 family transposase n=1 Tax=Pseudomonas aeruginosa TaxID=287 RepID=UPI0021ADD328|nr:IS5 family transposase [Pseudomonas aeruginosa]
MPTADLFRARLAHLIDPRHPLVVLASRLPWAQLEAAMTPLLARPSVSRDGLAVVDLFGERPLIAGGPSPAGRPRLPVRLMLSLLYLKHAFNLSDEAMVERWAENVYWQFFSGMEHFEPRLPCDATQVGRFRTAIGEAGVEELLKATIDCAVSTEAVKPDEFKRVIVDTTVQEKAIAYPTDSRLLEIARYQVVKAAKAAGIALKQTHAKEGKMLRRKAGGYAHAKQFKRLRRVLKRQRTILGIVIREVRRKLDQNTVFSPLALARLNTLLERAERIRSQKQKDKNKLYALHAPEVECIGKGKARQPYEFGVKASFAITHKRGLIVGARTFPGNPYDGHILSAQLEQTSILLEDVGVRPTQAVVDLGYRGVDADNPGVEILHRGWWKSMTKQQRRWLKRRQAVEPIIGHLKADHGMDRCWLRGATGDALHAVLCAAGFNLRWLLRAVARGEIRAVFLRLWAWSNGGETATSAGLGRWIDGVRAILATAVRRSWSQGRPALAFG